MRELGELLAIVIGVDFLAYVVIPWLWHFL